MDEIISYKMCAVKVRNAKLRNYLKYVLPPVLFTLTQVVLLSITSTFTRVQIQSNLGTTEYDVIMWEEQKTSPSHIMTSYCVSITEQTAAKSYLFVKRQFFSMSRICNEKCSKLKIFLAFLSKLLCFTFIL
jgi:hypothetical protein